jgi:DNA invertase Pin-like site-specific DNA recombinase
VSAHAVITYRRVSTEEQGDSGLGLEAQAAAIAAEVERRGWTATADYSDVASGKSTDGRPGLAAAIAHAQRTRGVLVASKLDRVSRSVLDYVKMIAASREQGWSMLVLDHANADPTTTEGRFVQHLMIALAERERDLIGERTSSALQALKARGTRLGRPRRTPLEVVQRVVRERDAGTYWQVIADGLNADGVPTVRGGSEWRVSTVQQIYKGHLLDIEAAQHRVGRRPALSD